MHGVNIYKLYILKKSTVSWQIPTICDVLNMPCVSNGKDRNNERSSRDFVYRRGHKYIMEIIMTYLGEKQKKDAVCRLYFVLTEHTKENSNRRWNDMQKRRLQPVCIIVQPVSIFIFEMNAYIWIYICK